MVKAFEISLPEFILHKTVDEVDENDNELLLADSISKHDFVEGDADLNSLLAYLPEGQLLRSHSRTLHQRLTPGFRIFKALHWKAAYKSSKHCKLY